MRFLGLVILAVLSVGAVHAQTVSPSSTVTVCFASDTTIPCSNYAPTYTDSTLATACTQGVNKTNLPTTGANCNNPGVTNASGSFTLNLAAGIYSICIFAQTYQCFREIISSSSGSGVTGSGTANTIPMWSGTTALTNSNLTQPGGGTSLSFTGTSISANSLNGGATGGTVVYTEGRTGNCIGSGFPFALPGSSGCQNVLGIEAYNGSSSSAQISAGTFIEEAPQGATNPGTSVGLVGEAYNDQAGTSLGVLAEGYQNVGFVSGQTNNWGLLAIADNNSAGTFPSNDAVRAQTIVGSGATNTADYTVHILAPTVTGTMTTHAGLKIETQGTGNAITTGTDPVSLGGNTSVASLATSTNCAATGTAANPSVASCSAAPAGSFSCATNASGGTCVVNTTAVTANSEIFITQRSDTTTGTRLSVTCNTTLTTAIPEITAVTAGTSFTINLGTITTNPECFSYFLVN